MRRMKANNAAKIVATFGAGLASTLAAPTAEGAIISLTPIPSSVFYNPFGPTSTFAIPVQLFPEPFVFGQFNDSQGKTFGTNAGGIVGFRSAPASQSITASQLFYSFISRQKSSSGISTFGFLTSAGQVGWLRIDFGGFPNNVIYLAAAYNDTPSGSIHAGSLTEPVPSVPEPTSLALAGLAALALGARARRKRAS